jgi:hypothetical protein
MKRQEGEMFIKGKQQSEGSKNGLVTVVKLIGDNGIQLVIPLNLFSLILFV